MKRFKKVLAGILSISILISSTAYAQSNVENTLGGQAVSDGFSPEMQEKAYESYKKLIHSFPVIDGTIEYPAYYGGAYLDDYGYLTVCISKEFSNENIRRQIMENIRRITENEEVKSEKVDFNYKQLDNAMFRINHYIKSDKHVPICKKVIKYYLDEKDSSVRVFIRGCTKQDEDDFKKLILNSDVVKFSSVEMPNLNQPSKEKKAFSQVEGSLLGETKVKPGSGLKLRSTAGNLASVGYKAVDKDGNIGFVTAAHTYLDKNDNISDTRTKIGDKHFGQVSSYKFGGNVDAAFIKCDKPEEFEISNEIDETRRISEELQPKEGDRVQGLQGMKVIRIGYYSTAEGKLNSTNSSLNIEGVHFSDLICADVSAMGGDSGGPLCALADSEGNCRPLGSNVSSDGIDSSFVKVKNSNKALGVTVTR